MYFYIYDQIEHREIDGVYDCFRANVIADEMNENCGQNRYIALPLIDYKYLKK